MLEPGTESIITALASPAILAAVIGFILKKYLERQDEALRGISDAIKIEQVKSAVAESTTDRTSVLVDEIRKDLQNIRDEHTKTRSSVEAAWRVLDIKRLS